MDAKTITKLVNDKAYTLLKERFGTPIGAKEFSGGFSSERCDAILFNLHNSFVIETKISRSDFLNDRKKKCRVDGNGVGNYRYYACPLGLIKVDELPPKWGLIYVDIDNPKKKASLEFGYRGYLKYDERESFKFYSTVNERRFLYALATRYKSEKFMDNIDTEPFSNAV